MGSTRGAVPTPSAKPTSHFFFEGEKCENPHCQAHLRVLQHQLESEKKMNRVLRENQEDLYWKPEQRSNDLLQNPLRNAFLGGRRSS